MTSGPEFEVQQYNGWWIVVVVAGASGSVRGRWVGRGNGSGGGSVEGPHAVLGGVPKLLRLADRGPHEQLQEGPATRPDYPTPQLHRRREEEVQRDAFGSHF